MPVLGEFVRATFGFSLKKELELYPELEDLFTMLDLSANTGHHLGPKYPPHELRKLRRMLLSRIIRMLYGAYHEGKLHEAEGRDDLLKFLRRIDPTRHGFVSLNWDTVLEGCFSEINVNLKPFYSSEIKAASVDDDGTLILDTEDAEQVRIAKVHGSINWLYCDCCRRTFSVPMRQVPLLASQVLKHEESLELYNERASRRVLCPFCGVDLSVRLATFSYRKALSTSSFESSWLLAEKQLRRSDRWVFIGYSLPAADFEFKYLLKRVALARETKPKIVVVTKLGKKASVKTDRTILSYKKFFGGNNPTFLTNGFQSDDIDGIV